MFARAEWSHSQDDNGVRAEAQDVLAASRALLRSFQARRETYHQWETEAAALLSELNRDRAVLHARGEFDA